METMTILSVAVAVEAAVLTIVIAALVRLRGRLGQEQVVSAAVVTQMDMLVQEARSISETLADQIAEQVELADRMRAQEEAALRKQALIADMHDEAPVSRSRKKASTAALAMDDADVEERPARTRKASTSAPRSAAAKRAADLQVAREKGMDPVGIALQRTLARERSLSA